MCSYCEESMQPLEKCDTVLILLNFTALLTCCKILFLCFMCSIATLLLIESVEIILRFDVF